MKIPTAVSRTFSSLFKFNSFLLRLFFPIFFFVAFTHRSAIKLFNKKDCKIFYFFTACSVYSFVYLVAFWRLSTDSLYFCWSVEFSCCVNKNLLIKIVKLPKLRKMITNYVQSFSRSLQYQSISITLRLSLRYLQPIIMFSPIIQ